MGDQTYPSSGGGGGGGEKAAPSAPALATKMEEDGNNDQNANIINLYLQDASLLVGGPQPIQAAQTTEPVRTLVFNGNFSRERYGEASVNDNISLQQDKIDLLLDNNQTEKEKALAFISCLKLQNGLNTVQAMSNGQVTNRTQPDLDILSNYPESLFNNAAELNSTKEDFVFDAIAASTQATQALTSYE